MNNLTSIYDKLKSISLGNSFINDFSIGDVYDINSDKNKFPLINVTLSEIKQSIDTSTFEFDIFYVDRVLSDKSNENSIQEDSILMLSQFVNKLNTLENIDIDYNNVITPFVDKFSDICAGSYIKVNMMVDNYIGSCSELVLWEENTKYISAEAVIMNDGSNLEDTLNNKVDKIGGKGLSTNDYTNEEKNKLQGLSNYDDTIIKNNLNNKVDKIVGKGLSTNDYTNEEKSKLNTTEQISNKVTVINENSTDAQYPSAKAVYDSTEALLHKFILSCKFVLYDGLKFGGSSIIKAENFDTSSVTNMMLMFYDCQALTNLDLSNFDTSRVTNMMQMFRNCYALTTLDLSNFDTSSVTNIGYMFCDCRALTNLDLSNFDTSSVTTMRNMFNNCYGLTNLDLSNFDTSNVTDMQNMFYGCYRLTNLDLSNFDTSNVTNMRYMFNYCYGLTNLDLSNFDTSSVTDMQNMFNYCYGLANLDLSNFDTSSVTDMQYMFNGCSKLTNLKFGNLTQSVDLSFSSLLTNESILYMIQKAKPITTITITLHPDAYARAIADTEIQVALAAQSLITLISA